MSFNGYPFELLHPTPGAVGNAALAFLCLRIVFPRIPLSTLQYAFSRVQNPGRFEIVQENPRVILSGDHNPAGVADLLATLDKTGVGRVKTVCAFSPDKPHRELYERLKGISDEIYLTQSSRFRGKQPESYASLGKLIPNPLEAVSEMLARTEPQETLLVTGSLYLVGEVRPLWRRGVSFWRETPPAESPAFASEDAAIPPVLH